MKELNLISKEVDGVEVKMGGISEEVEGIEKVRMARVLLCACFPQRQHYICREYNPVQRTRLSTD